MLVTLYTSRVVLEVLGVEDFGIYNVVGGVVAMFGFLNSSMAITTQRFLNFEMGRNDFVKLNRVFSLSVSFHVVIAIVIFILAETIGIWFLNTKLNIPQERMVAANWIYHFSVLSAMITVIQVPYNATIIAYERMNIYAYVSIIDVFLKLSIVFLLSRFELDKLKLYAVLIFVVTLLIALIYRVYCLRKFSICRYRPTWDKDLFLDLFSQSSWNLLGTSALVVSGQGGMMILNVFFGVALNAASGIASQVHSAVSLFVTNFITAIRPQVVKLYAVGDIEKMQRLVYNGAILSFFLMFALAFPLLFYTELLLSIWLRNVPEYCILFTRLLLIDGLINTITVPLRTAIQASGRVKYYQISVSSILMLSIPFTYLLFKLGFPPETLYAVIISSSIMTLIVRIILLNRIIGFSWKKFIKLVLLRVIIVTIPIVILGMLAISFGMSGTISDFLLIMPPLVLLYGILVFYWGISHSMRTNVINFIHKKICLRD